MSEQQASARKLTDHPFLKRRGRIVFTLLAVLVLIGLAPLGTVAWKLIDINREALSTAQREYQLLMASTVANELDIHVDGLRSQLMRVAVSILSSSKMDALLIKQQSGPPKASAARSISA